MGGYQDVYSLNFKNCLFGFAKIQKIFVSLHPHLRKNHKLKLVIL